MVGTESGELQSKSSKRGAQEEDNREERERQDSPENTEGKPPAAGHRETDKKSSMNTGEYLLIALAVLLIVIVIGGGMFIWARYGTSDGAKEAALAGAQGPLYQLNPFFVPLKAQAGAEKLLRVTISLELSGERSSQEVIKQIREIRGMLLQTLLSAVPKDFEYTHGKKALMDRMRTSINHFLGKELVQGIRFTNAVLL